jgi:hypothetical protein
MASSVTLAGTTYSVPSDGERGWSSLSTYLVALATRAFPTAGGSYTMSAELALATFGIKAPWFKSATASAADAGVLRLASADLIDWRNNANAANLALGKDSSDNLEWNGVDLVTVSGTQTLTNKTLTSPVITNPTITGFTTGGFTILFGCSNTTVQNSMGAGVAQKLIVGGPNGTSGSSAQRLIMPQACTLKAVTSWTAQAAASTTTVMVQKDGVDTAATYAHATSSQTGSASGLSVAFTASQQVGVNITFADLNNTQWSSANVCLYFEF